MGKVFFALYNLVSKDKLADLCPEKKMSATDTKESYQYPPRINCLLKDKYLVVSMKREVFFEKPEISFSSVVCIQKPKGQVRYRDVSAIVQVYLCSSGVIPELVL